MAAPHLRVVRRARGSSRRALTAASQLVEDPSTSFKSSVVSSRNDWQDIAWDMLDAVGELRYYVAWRASSCSRVRLIASELDPDTGLPSGECENARVVEVVKAIAGGTLGQAQLIKRAVEGLTVPGELWVAIITDAAGAEQWLVLSRDEIKTKGKTVEVLLPTGQWQEIAVGQDTLFRVWNPRPRRAHEADSPVRASLDSLREIVRTTKTISNASKSRLIGNGVVFVPHEMSLPVTNTVSGYESDLALTGTPAVQQLQELLFQVAQTAYEDEDSMAALIPMFAAVPGEQVKNVSHLKFDNSVTDIAIKTRNDAISRLAMGLDVSPERLLGLGSTSNHWSAWAIGEEDVRLHIIPPVETLCAALTDHVLAAVLEREGIDPSRYVVWHDAAALTADPDLSASATNAFDRGVITADAYREFLGLGDTGYDFSTMDGWQQWARDRVSVDPTLLKTLAPLIDELDELALPEPQPPQLQPVPPPVERNPEQEPQTEPQAARSAVVDLMVGRALELAGKRRRTRADYDRLRDVPMHQTHRFMDAVDDAAVDALIKGWDSAVDDDALARLGLTYDDLRSAVYRQARTALTRPVVDG